MNTKVYTKTERVTLWLLRQWIYKSFVWYYYTHFEFFPWPPEMIFWKRLTVLPMVCKSSPYTRIENASRRFIIDFPQFKNPIGGNLCCETFYKPIFPSPSRFLFAPASFSLKCLKYGGLSSSHKRDATHVTLLWITVIFHLEPIITIIP